MSSSQGGSAPGGGSDPKARQCLDTHGPPETAASPTSEPSWSGDESQAGDNDDDDAADWQDVEVDEEFPMVVSLFDDATFPDLKSMLAYCREKFNFDFLSVRERLGLDFHGAVKLCNFVRGRVRDGVALPDVISAQDMENDDLLRPVLEDDALILLLDDVLEDERASAPAPAPSSAQASEGQDEARERNRRLEAELSKLQDQFASYRLAVEETLDRRWGDDASACSEPKFKPPVDKDSGYWESYAGRDIHEIMLKDRVRTDAYRDFVYENKHVFQDKVVLDLGCGTGILSLFCARAGARKVVAVDNSAIINKARENVFNNGLSNVITCISGRIEDVKLPVDQVDVIISEWMGYCLLYEAMLPSVLWARDKYLRPDGLLVPSHATIWASPLSDGVYVDENMAFWHDVYGFNMDAMQEGIYDDVRMQHMAKESLCGEPFPLSQLKLHHTTVADLTFKASWSTRLSRDIDHLDGFLVWFDIFFASSRDGEEPAPNMTAAQWASKSNGAVAFTTGPFGPETHWRQGLLLAPRAQAADSPPLKSGSEVSGDASFSTPESDARALQIGIGWTGVGQTRRSRSWRVR